MSNFNISARNIGSLLGKCPWNDRWKTFLKIVKINKDSSKATQHGIKYESEAINMYKLVSGNNDITIDKKICRHPKYKHLTGQVDGIVNLENDKKAILEVKCPYTDIIFNPLKFEVKELYWIQVQIYMEIHNIDICHFCEYYRFDDNNIFFRWKEIERDIKWFEELGGVMDNFINIIGNTKKRKLSDTGNISECPKGKKRKLN